MNGSNFAVKEIGKSLRKFSERNRQDRSEVWILLYHVDSNAEQLFGRCTGQNLNAIKQNVSLMYDTVNEFVNGMENLFMNLQS